MLLIAYFTNEGSPATGLTPTVDVWEHDGSQVVTAQSMTEIAGGGYYYDFTTYDESKDYFIRANGGVTLPNFERYVYSTNEIGQVTDAITDVQVDITIIKQLVHSNIIIDNVVNDANGNMTSCRKRIFPTLADKIAQTNVIHTYTVSAVYDANGFSIGYDCQEDS